MWRLVIPAVVFLCLTVPLTNREQEQACTGLDDPATTGLFALEPAEAEREHVRAKPATLAAALARLDQRPEWTDRPDLSFPVHPAEKYLRDMTIVLDPGHGVPHRDVL